MKILSLMFTVLTLTTALSASAHASWICEAKCVRVSPGTLGNIPVLRYWSCNGMQGPAAESAQAAFLGLENQCKLHTPAAYRALLAVEVYTRDVQGVPLLTNRTVYANINNSCYQQ